MKLTFRHTAICLLMLLVMSGSAGVPLCLHQCAERECSGKCCHHDAEPAPVPAGISEAQCCMDAVLSFSLPAYDNYKLSISHQPLISHCRSAHCAADGAPLGSRSSLTINYPPSPLLYLSHRQLRL